MRKIDKKLDLAIAYRDWLNDLRETGRQHPIYNSTKGRYYYDIFANLLWAQNGLCAYTEIKLTEAAEFAPELWNNGRFDRFKTFGQLDHYDHRLKNQLGWEWANLFVVHSDINTKCKKDKDVFYILKPDIPNYDPWYYLSYDHKNHIFCANPDRTPEEIQTIEKEISVLGLNFRSVVILRKDRLTSLLVKIEFGKITYSDAIVELTEFPTAFKMAFESLEKSASSGS